jgi:mRNA interferase HigB
MRIISKKRLKEFWIRYPDSEKPLRIWFSICKKELFRNFNDVRSFFNTTDYYEEKTIFNIGGNKYRLITVIQYKIKTIFIKGVYTHEEYEKGKWKK